MKTSLSAARTLLGVIFLAGCASSSSPDGAPSSGPVTQPANEAADAAPSGSMNGEPGEGAASGDDGGPTPENASDDGASNGDDAASVAADDGPSAVPTEGGAPGTASADGGGACTITAAAAQCNSLPLVTITDSADTRTVYWAQPAGAAPQAGWPAVVLYQGTGFGPSVTWNVSIGPTTPFGGYYQVVVVSALLDAGFVVIQPPADGVAWDTNDPGDYDTSPDAAFIPQLLSAIGGGTFGPVDTGRLYATGISSGGYMTSRMAVSYAGRFRALAIESGSYATCVGPVCAIPPVLPSNHPPTLFLHGGMDPIVPIGTAQAYYQALMAQGVDTSFVEDPSAGHQWLSVAPQDVVQWFTSH